MSEEAAKPRREPKVTVHETPTEQVIRESLKEATITDSRGRKIRLTKPSILSQFRLPLIVGAEASSNPLYMRMILPLLFVSAIDGDVVFFPSTHLQLEALIERLGEEGVAAVSIEVEAKFGAGDIDTKQDAVKN